MLFEASTVEEHGMVCAHEWTMDNERCHFDLWWQYSSQTVFVVATVSATIGHPVRFSTILKSAKAVLINTAGRALLAN